MMKRLYILLAAVALLGCDEQGAIDEITSPLEVETKAAAPIRFTTEPTVSLTSKSDIVEVSADIASFGVYAYSVTSGTDAEEYCTQLIDEDNIMANRRVQRSDITDPTSSWTYTPTEYWNTDTEDENGDAYGDDDAPAIYFLAYSPYSSGLIDTNIDGSTSSEELGSNYDVNTVNGINSYMNNNHIYISYSMPSEVRNQPDILVSEPVVMRYTESTEEDAEYDCDPVSFSFNHTLATVGFKLEGNSSYQLLAVALVGIYDYADIVIGESANDWDNKSSSYNKENDPYYTKEYSNYYIYGAAGIYFAGLSDDLIPDGSSTPKSVTAEDGYLMVIPQSIMNDVRLHVQYTYASEDVPDDYDPSEGYLAAYSTYYDSDYDFDIFTMDYYLGGSRGWYGNNNYYYVITLP